jgi:hypothetical protein
LRSFKGKAAFIACAVTATIFFGSGVLPAPASTCVECHTDEAALKHNLSKVEKKKSALTFGTG